MSGPANIDTPVILMAEDDPDDRLLMEEAVAEARGLAQGQNGGRKADDDWSPAIAVGMPVMIPDSYVGDLTVRLGLYRRLAWLSEGDEINAFAAALLDRFGPRPGRVGRIPRSPAGTSTGGGATCRATRSSRRWRPW